MATKARPHARGLLGSSKQGAVGAAHRATGTLATPFGPRPGTYSGHGDLLAGLVATNDAWATELRKMRVITGNVLHRWPLIYLLHRGLPTLPIRVRAAQEHARVLAERPVRHRAVRAVYQRPRFEPRARYPSEAACAAPRVGARLQPGAELRLVVSRLEGAEHLPIVELERAA